MGFLTPSAPCKPRPGAQIVDGHPLNRGLCLALLFSNGFDSRVLDFSKYQDPATIYGTLTSPNGWIGDGYHIDKTAATWSCIGWPLLSTSVWSPSNFVPSTEFTMAVRLRRSAAATAWARVFEVEVEGDNPPYTVCGFQGNSDGSLVAGMATFSDASVLWIDFPALGYEWHTLVVTYDYAYLRIYLDGSLVGISANSVKSFGGSYRRRMVLGNNPESGSKNNGFSGDYDWAMAWTRALTPDEVFSLSLYPFGTPGNPRWGFCQNLSSVDTNLFPLVISAFGITAITKDSAVAAWATNKDATSEIDWGRDLAYGFYAGIDESEQFHSVQMTGLQPGTTYHVRAKSRWDLNASQFAFSEDLSFTTLADSVVDPGTIPRTEMHASVITLFFDEPTGRKDYSYEGLVVDNEDLI